MKRETFYVILHALSNKMNQIKEKLIVSICGDWFTAHDVGENIGHILDSESEEIASKLRASFAEWYDKGHANETDPNTGILRIRFTSGVLFSYETRYDIDFVHNQ